MLPRILRLNTNTPTAVVCVYKAPQRHRFFTDIAEPDSWILLDPIMFVGFVRYPTGPN